MVGLLFFSHKSLSVCLTGLWAWWYCAWLSVGVRSLY